MDENVGEISFLFFYGREKAAGRERKVRPDNGKRARTERKGIVYGGKEGDAGRESRSKDNVGRER